jgi:hypothetical protein
MGLATSIGVTLIVQNATPAKDLEPTGCQPQRDRSLCICVFTGRKKKPRMEGGNNRTELAAFVKKYPEDKIARYHQAQASNLVGGYAASMSDDPKQRGAAK